MTGRRSVCGSGIWPCVLYRLGFILLLGFLSACGVHSGAVLRESSLNFNQALQRALSEQMLLNLVRLRYGEPPVFLQVTSISTQFSFSGNAGAGAEINEAYPDSYSLNLGFSYAARPTFTFVPLQGEEFAKRLLSPIRLGHLLLLLNSGWRADRVLRLCVQRLNDIPNAPTASGPTPIEVPRFRRFLRVSRDFEALRRRGYLRFLYLEKGGSPFPALRISSAARELPEYAELLRLLKLEPAPYYRLVGPEGPPAPNVLRVETRSLIGVLFYLSQGVEVPEEDLRAGRAARTLKASGAPFNWSEVLGDLFRVSSSATLPRRALLAVRYRGRWFYIADQDRNSKATFILLQQLFALEASKGKGISPLLTLPVAQ